MNTDNSEQKLKALFNELRAEDSRWAPSFNAIARASSSGATAWPISFPWCRLALGTIAVALFVAGITVTAIRLHTRSFEKEMQQWKALSEWEAPSDTLLGNYDAPR
jgi:hypothetical protein